MSMIALIAMLAIGCLVKRNVEIGVSIHRHSPFLLPVHVPKWICSNRHRLSRKYWIQITIAGQLKSYSRNLVLLVYHLGSKYIAKLRRNCCCLRTDFRITGYQHTKCTICD